VGSIIAGLEEVVGKNILCQGCAWAGSSIVPFSIHVNGRLGMVSLPGRPRRAIRRAEPACGELLDAHQKVGGTSTTYMER